MRSPITILLPYMTKPQKTVTIRIRAKTRDRLKIRAIREGRTLMSLLDYFAHLSKEESFTVKGK